MARTHDHAADIALQEYGTVTLLSVARPSRVLRRVAGSIKGDVKRKTLLPGSPGMFSDVQPL